MRIKQIIVYKLYDCGIKILLFELHDILKDFLMFNLLSLSEKIKVEQTISWTLFELK